MIDSLFDFPTPFAKTSKKTSYPIIILNNAGYAPWKKKQKKVIQNQLDQNSFDAKPNTACVILNAAGEVEQIIHGASEFLNTDDGAFIADFIEKNLSRKLITSSVFEIEGAKQDLEKYCVGWGLASYIFDKYKKMEKTNPILKWPEKVSPSSVTNLVHSITLLRHLINTPANDLGTDELAKAAEKIAKAAGAKFSVIKDQKKLEKEFPMIYAVGKASPRTPKLIDFSWGDKKNPSITLVGKGIVYDTGGLDIKPRPYMRHMKKDMGGSAHVLGLAMMIMAEKLPIHLRVLIPTAENSVAGNSFRSGDVINTRKGLTVEIGDTDAEGRLVVGDALTYACEKKPDLLIDFCTLTGAARVALGFDVPAFFSNNDDIVDTLRKDSPASDDAIWPLPLWAGYDKELNSTVADMTNDGSGRAGAIHGALFLQRFIDPSVDWVHLDVYAWEQAGRPGRPKEGSDTGMRAIYDFIKNKYTA